MIFPSTNSQKILWLMIDEPFKKYQESDIGKFVKISKAGINFALRDLTRQGLVSRQKIGTSFLYFLNHLDPFIKQLKVLKNIQFLTPIIKKIIPFSNMVILFGSASRGENTKDSDYDIFILTNNKEAVVSKLSKCKKMQPVIKNQVELIECEKKDPVFYQEIQCGIILHDEKSRI